MAKINKVDSNITGLRYCEETSLGVLPVAADQVWVPTEPNTYNNFGTTITTVARNPINAGRQRKKGVTTTVDSAGGFNTDVTQTNLQDVLQGFFFADAREKFNTLPLNGAAIPITSVVASSHKYEASTGLVMAVGDLMFASGFTNATNNGLRHATAVDPTFLTVTDTLTNETPTAGAGLSHVGFQFVAGDAVITVSGGNFPTLVTTTKDMTTFGITPGEWIFIGGDTGLLASTHPTNNGFARVRSVTAHLMTFDKTAGVMVDVGGDDSAQTIQIFFGRVLKNEQGTLIKRRSYTLERQLGYNNDADITLQQAEYIRGAIANEFTFTVTQAAKVTADVSFQGLNGYTLDENTEGVVLLSKVEGATALAITESDAFNTSSDVARINLSPVTDGVSDTTPLFAFVQEITFGIKNNLVANKAVGVVGAFEVTAGLFEVSGKITAYFADVAAVSAVQQNENISLDTHLVKSNAGITLDLPLLTLGDGRPTVAQDQPITLPLTHDAASGARVNAALNYTMLMVFWDYLPNAAG